MAGLRIGGVNLPISARELAILAGAVGVVVVGQQLVRRGAAAGDAQLGGGINLAPSDFLGIISSTAGIAAAAAGQGAGPGASLGAAGLGAGAQLGIGGLELAGRAVDALERNASTTTRALADVATRSGQGLVDLATRPVESRPFITDPIPAPRPMQPIVAPPIVATPTPAPVASQVTYPAPPPAIARYYPTSADLAAAIRATGQVTQPVKLVTGEWVYP